MIESKWLIHTCWWVGWPPPNSTPRGHDVEVGAAVLALARAGHLAAEVAGDQLGAVADAEHGHAEVVDGGVDAGRAVDVDRLRAAAEDHAGRVARGQLGGGDRVRDDLAVDVRLADAAGDELRVLGAEVDDEDRRTVADRWVTVSAARHATQLGLLQLLERGVAAEGHRPPQRADQVGRPGRRPPGRRRTSSSVPRVPTATRAPRGSVGWPRARPQWQPAAGGVDGGGERRAEHDGVGAAHDRLGDVAAGGHAAVGDEVDVHAGLVEVAHAGGPGVGDGGGLGDADAEHPPGAGRAGRRRRRRGSPAAPVRIRWSAAW